MTTEVSTEEMLESLDNQPSVRNLKKARIAIVIFRGISVAVCIGFLIVVFKYSVSKLFPAKAKGILRFTKYFFIIATVWLVISIAFEGYRAYEYFDMVKLVEEEKGNERGYSMQVIVGILVLICFAILLTNMLTHVFSVANQVLYVAAKIVVCLFAIYVFSGFIVLLININTPQSKGWAFYRSRKAMQSR